MTPFQQDPANIDLEHRSWIEHAVIRRFAVHWAVSESSLSL